jgi:hypothetical protein
MQPAGNHVPSNPICALNYVAEVPVTFSAKNPGPLPRTLPLMMCAAITHKSIGRAAVVVIDDHRHRPLSHHHRRAIETGEARNGAEAAPRIIPAGTNRIPKATGTGGQGLLKGPTLSLAKAAGVDGIMVNGDDLALGWGGDRAANSTANVSPFPVGPKTTTGFS